VGKVIVVVATGAEPDSEFKSSKMFGSAINCEPGSNSEALGLANNDAERAGELRTEPGDEGGAIVAGDDAGDNEAPVVEAAVVVGEATSKQPPLLPFAVWPLLLGT